MACCAKGAIKDTPAETERLFKLLNNYGDGTILKKHFTQAILQDYKKKKTKYGGTLCQNIRGPCLYPDERLGFHFTDPDVYTIYSSLLDAVIKAYFEQEEIDHPRDVDFGFSDGGFVDPPVNLELPENLDQSEQYIRESRVLLKRNLDGLPFQYLLNEKQRQQIETDLGIYLSVLKRTDDSFACVYVPYESRDFIKKRAFFEENHSMMTVEDVHKKTAGVFEQFPSGRGVYHFDKEDFAVWVNMDDHYNLMSFKSGANLLGAYSKLVTCVEHLAQQGVKFAQKDGYGFLTEAPNFLGTGMRVSFRVRLPLLSQEKNFEGKLRRYLTFCPSNLGTGMRVSFHMKIPLLAQQPNFEALCKSLGLQARGVDGEHTESKDGVYDISNIQRLGKTELDIIRDLAKAVTELIEKEQKLEVDTEKAAKPTTVEKADEKNE